MADQNNPLDLVTYEALTQGHPEREFWAAAYENHRLMYEGGERFLLAAGQRAETRAARAAGTSRGVPLLDMMGPNRRRRFLHQLEGEPEVKYISRWERAYYIGYLGAIVDYFRNWLFSSQPAIRPADGGKSAPDWSAAFIENATGGGTSMLDVAKEAFLDVLLCRHGGWLISTPTLDGRAASPVITRYAAEDMVDWQCDAQGELEWIVLRKEESIRMFPDKRMAVETFTYVDRYQWRAWQVIEGEKSKELQTIGGDEHGLGRCPFVMMEVPHGLWLAAKLASWQIDLFNQMSMLSQGQLLSCFLQPFIRSNEDGAENRIFSEGLLLKIRAGGLNDPGEDFGWKSPDIAPLDFQAKRLIEQRDEGYRIVHQMALAVDSQAVGSVSRSGESKREDRRSSEIILAAYGGIVRPALKKTLDLISMIMGDGIEWTVDGYDNFTVSTLDEELQIAALVQTFRIPSKTFKKELYRSIATGRVLPRLDEKLKQAIGKEIDDSVDAEPDADQLAMVEGQIGPGTGNEPSDDEQDKNADADKADAA